MGEPNAAIVTELLVMAAFIFRPSFARAWATFDWRVASTCSAGCCASGAGRVSTDLRHRRVDRCS
jgi:hypothetical protein